MDIEKKRSFIINILYYTICLGLIYVTLRYGIYLFFPFLMGFFIAFILKPLIKRIQKYTKLPMKLVSIVVLILFYVIIIYLLTFLSMNFYVWLKDFLTTLPQTYKSDIEPALYQMGDYIQLMVSNFDSNAQMTMLGFIEQFQDNLGEIFTSLSSGLLLELSYFAKGVPSFVLSLFFTILTSFFCIYDYKKITVFIMSLLPEYGQIQVLKIKRILVNSVLSFIKGYAKIMSITFIELLIGLYVLGIENAWAIALIIALFDILPLLGTGGIMIPWILISYMNGQSKLATGLLVVYLIITLVRNIVEPKIVGKQLGLHPLLMLLCIFLGAKLFGIIGFILMPITAIIVKEYFFTKDETNIKTTQNMLE